MRIIKCDKCGKEIQEDKDRLYKVYKDNGDEPVTFDYCDVCYPQLVTWIMTNTTDTLMSERQVLEKFEKWLIDEHFGWSVDTRTSKFIVGNDCSAIDEYLKEEGIEE